MIMSGRSYNLITLFLGTLRPQFLMHILSPVTDNRPSRISGRKNESLWPDRISSPGPLAREFDLLPTALCSPATRNQFYMYDVNFIF